MRDRHLSIIIIPHPRGKQRTITISKKANRFLLIALPALLVLLIGVLVDYGLMNGTRKKFHQLQDENVHQQETLAQYRSSIEKLEASLSTFERYREKLNVIAGLKAEAPLEGDPGLGGPIDHQTTVPSLPNQDFGRLQQMQVKADSIASNFSTLSNLFENQQTELAQTPSISPTQGYWSSSFGYREDPFTGKRAFHPGVDIATQQGNPVFSTADGIIISTKNEKNGGRTVKISHPNTGYVTVYCHLSKFNVRSGQRVKRGDVIGLIGRTGRAKGPHVHYEVRLNGKKLNPWNFILDI